ncbi:hypothetical protein Taro_038576 [Colocasia esculenta]|uniref:Histone-lysine N-methyltransferase, H3 lysine-9 specific SUVH1 n=1 Tax=Colocasia esculenta TaxID=4460 RepID=A0A843WD69_COLES|nr:hypothetical protein [Colocasia esculenta]
MLKSARFGASNARTATRRRTEGDDAAADHRERAAAEREIRAEVEVVAVDWSLTTVASRRGRSSVNRGSDLWMESRGTHGASSSKESEVLDVKPLRTLSPMFPTPFGYTSVSPPGAPPFLCISPFSPFPAGAHGPSSFFPMFPSPAVAPTPAGRPSKGNDPLHRTPGGFQTPPPAGAARWGGDAGISGGTASSSGKGSRKKIERRPKRNKPDKTDLMLLPSSSEDPNEAVEVLLMTFDALRRRILQLDEGNPDNTSRRPDMRAGAIMMDYDLRVNKAKRVGSVPGIEVGDIFYFRMETLLVGLHSQSMGGIDYMVTKVDGEDDTLAVSVVSSGGYEDETDDVDSLVYSGSGEKNDQKLERGNLALDRSTHRGNQIRVTRGMKDLSFPTGRIYVYDGLYKIHGSWVEKGKSGFNVFKYKLVREPGQPDAFATWKMTEKWKQNPSSRGRVILPDISSGGENIPVFLVNEVDSEKGPRLFSYATKVKYSVPMNPLAPLHACSCLNVCLPGDAGCSCAQRNGGALPYSSNGLLASRKSLLYECGPSCACTGNCRNKMAQKGIKLHFEVFKTRNRDWGLRSWDAIRTGSFICEYVGEVIDKSKVEADGEEDQYLFEANYSDEKMFKWNYGPELIGEPSSASSGEVSKSPPIILSAKHVGNIGRFMNHSCSPNVFWQPVLYDHGDENYPHIMFFAAKHIPPMTELTYDYGMSGRKVKKCFCGSAKCRGFFSEP